MLRLHVLLVTLVGLFPVTMCVPVCVKGQRELAGGAVAGQVPTCVSPCLRFLWDLMPLLNLFLSSKIL